MNEEIKTRASKKNNEQKKNPKKIFITLNPETNDADKRIADFWKDTKKNEKNKELKSIVLMGLGIKQMFPNMEIEEAAGFILGTCFQMMMSGNTQNFNSYKKEDEIDSKKTLEITKEDKELSDEIALDFL